MVEIWKKIPGYSRYMVSNTGKIKSLNFMNLKEEKEIKLFKKNSGYMGTSVTSDYGIRKNVLIHRLVLLAFMGESDLVVNHKDGNKLNNNIYNLEYCSPSENTQHAYKNGLHPSRVSTKNPAAKLNENQVIEIRLYAEKHGCLKNAKELCQKYGVAGATLRRIVQRKNYADIN